MNIAVAAISVSAQDYVAPPVKISNDKVRIDGKVYYSHIVEERQTMYSISKAYNVSLDEIYAANPGLKENGLKENGLKKNAIINIPVAEVQQEVKPRPEPEVTQETAPAASGDIQKVHTVKWYENLSDIAAKYGVSSEAIMAANGMTDIKLRNRQKLIIPSAESAETLVAEAKEAKTPSETTTAAEEEDMNLETAFDKDEEETDADIIPTAKNHIKAIALLPLKATGSTSSKSNMDFYCGMLLALRDLGEMGVNVSMDVHDIANGSFGATKQELETSDMVIGPVSPADITRLYSIAPGIKALISPLDPKAESLIESYNTMIHVPSPRHEQYDDVAKWIGEDLQAGDKVIVISEKEARKGDEGILMKAALDSAGITYTAFSYSILDGRKVQEPLEAKMTQEGVNRVLVASESEAFVNDVVRNLNILAYRKLNITLYAPAKIRTFETIEVENLHNTNLHISLAYNIDYDSPSVQDFIMKYRGLYMTEPSQFAYQGYDTAKYFISLCNKYGKDWHKRINTSEQEMLQSSFNFHKAEEGGYVNRGVRRLVYGSKWTISSPKN